MASTSTIDSPDANTSDDINVDDIVNALNEVLESLSHIPETEAVDIAPVVQVLGAVAKRNHLSIDAVLNLVRASIDSGDRTSPSEATQDSEGKRKRVAVSDDYAEDDADGWTYTTPESTSFSSQVSSPVARMIRSTSAMPMRETAVHLSDACESMASALRNNDDEITMIGCAKTLVETLSAHMPGAVIVFCPVTPVLTEEHAAELQQQTRRALLTLQSFYDGVARSRPKDRFIRAVCSHMESFQLLLKYSTQAGVVKCDDPQASMDRDVDAMCQHYLDFHENIIEHMTAEVPTGQDSDVQLIVEALLRIHSVVRIWYRQQSITLAGAFRQIASVTLEEARSVLTQTIRSIPLVLYDTINRVHTNVPPTAAFFVGGVIQAITSFTSFFVDHTCPILLGHVISADPLRQANYAMWTIVNDMTGNLERHMSERSIGVGKFDISAFEMRASCYAPPNPASQDFSYQSTGTSLPAEIGDIDDTGLLPDLDSMPLYSRSDADASLAWIQEGQLDQHSQSTTTAPIIQHHGGFVVQINSAFADSLS